MRYLLVGLGNPGTKYQDTRHNIGFMAIDRLARRHGLSLSQTKFEGRYTSGRIGQNEVVLLEPQTFMNLSGKSVAAAAKFFQIEVGQVLVAHDEIDIGVGKFQVKLGGGHGGHNGLRDMVEKLGSRDFVRLRMGVGRPNHPDVAGYVLNRFEPHEQPAIDALIERAADAFEIILQEGVARAQNRLNDK